MARRLLIPLMPSSKGLIRSLTRGGTASGRQHPAERRQGRLAEPAACERCGAIFRHRVWRRGRAPSHAFLTTVKWVVCPACRQVGAEEFLGRVLVRGEPVQAQDALVRRRIENVAARARAKQPERRVVSVERRGNTLEVLTTSQKLAHRIVHALQRLLGGQPRYRWSDDGSLYATLDCR